MTMTELERRALLGDKDAQEECTEMGIVLKCPFCGGPAEIHETESGSEHAAYKNNVPKGARILKKVVYPSGSEIYEYRRKTFVPRCSKTNCSGRKARQYKTIESALSAWNTRPVPPIFRCVECANATHHGENIVRCEVFDRDMMPDDFCSQFEVKGEL